jgi:hypothetical protein
LVLSTFKKEYPKEVGIPKCVFPSLLKKLLDTCNPGQYLAAAFDRCGLYPINPSRGMERIPSRDMEEDEGTVRALLSATFGEKLEELRGVGDLEKKKRGKKVMWMWMWMLCLVEKGMARAGVDRLMWRVRRVRWRILTSGWQKEGRAPASPREAAGQWGAARWWGAARRRAARWWGAGSKLRCFLSEAMWRLFTMVIGTWPRWRARSRRRRLRATLS